tara:strand:- start:1574 stop:2020 length:447 start_codon:yes stop_codon:yes gene_type:complete
LGLFLSTYTNRVDKKGRVSFPASFRSALENSNSIVLFKSHNHEAIEGFSIEKMEDLSNRLDAFDIFSDTQDDLATTIFAEAMPLNIDGDGRILLPADLIEFAQIDEEASFIGMGTKFQIWSPALLKERKASARNQVKEKNLTLPKTES